MTKPRPDIAFLFLHALPFDGRMWRAQCDALVQTTYAPTLYEFGQDISDWARHALDLAKTKKLVVVGCSVGGSCAIEIARQAEERIAALVLIGTKAHHAPDPEFHKSAIHHLRTQGVKAAWEKNWHMLMGREPNARAFAERIALQQTRQALENGITAFHTRPCGHDVISGLNVPVHIVTGAEDPLPGVGYARTLAKSTKHGRLHIVKSCGHYVPLFQPNALNAILGVVLDDIT